MHTLHTSNIITVFLKAMASLTAPDTLVPSWDELVYQCGSDHCCYVLLLMAQCCISTEKTDDKAVEKLVKVSAFGQP